MLKDFGGVPRCEPDMGYWCPVMERPCHLTHGEDNVIIVKSRELPRSKLRVIYSRAS
jgi:hypothetical protein